VLKGNLVSFSFFPNFLTFWLVLLSFCNLNLWDNDLELAYKNTFKILYLVTSDITLDMQLLN